MSNTRERNIYEQKDGSLTVTIRRYGKRHWVGTFHDMGDAIKARDETLERICPKEKEEGYWDRYRSRFLQKGTKVGMLTVGDPFPKTVRNGMHETYYHCTCECGREKDVSHKSLSAKTTCSCGCKRMPYNIKLSAKNRTGVKGVSPHGKNGKFQATIACHGKRHYLGTFDTIEEAERVRKDAEQRLKEGKPLE